MYRLGPEGFILQLPAKLTLPVSGNRVAYVSPFGNSASSVAVGPALGTAGLLADGATLWFSIVVNTPWTAGATAEPT